MTYPKSLDQVVTDLCVRAGLDDSQLDVTALAGLPCLGYPVTGAPAAAEALRILAQAFFFDSCESDGKLKFVPMGIVDSGTIVQGVSDGVLFGATTVTFAAPNTAGNILLALCKSDNANPAPSDTAGNTWIPLYVANGNIGGVGIWYAIAKQHTGNDSITFDNQGLLFSHQDAWCIEVTDMPAPPPVAVATGNSSTPSVSLGGLTISVTVDAGPLQWTMALIGNIAFLATPPGSGAFPLTVPSGWEEITFGPHRAWTAVLIPTALPPAFVIPENDLGLKQDKTKITEQISQEQDLPRDVTVIYADPALDYQPGNQLKGRNSRVVQTKNRKIISTPLTLTAIAARQIAEKDLFLAWLERNSYSMNLWKALYSILDPTDVVQFVYKGATFTMRIVQNSIGRGLVIGLDGVNYDARNFVSTISAGIDSGFSPMGIVLASNTLLFLFDIPLLQDTDSNPGGTGMYDGMSSGISAWPGGVLYVSPDDSSFAQQDATIAPLSFGFAASVLGAPRFSPWTWDEFNTLTITMSRGTLASDSALNVLNGSNQLIVGREIIQFRTATLNSDGTYTLSGLLRGRRGTEWATGSHALNEFVCLPASGLDRVKLPLSIVNLLRYYRAVTVGQDLTTAASQQFTNTGNDLRPYAPTSISGSRDGSGNLSLSWLRRTRIGGEWLDGVGDVPLSEDSEAYEIDVLNGASVVRTIAGLSSPAAPYSAAQQTADFGSPQSSLALRVYQLSAQIGRGFAGAATV